MNRVNEKICRSDKSQGDTGHRKVKCKISQALVIINLYVKFIVHSTYEKVYQPLREVADTPFHIQGDEGIVLKVADRRMDGRAR